MLNVASFLPALTAVVAVVERRNTVPILSNVMLSATGDRLKVSATDLDCWTEADLDAFAVGDWATTIPAAALLAFLKTCDKASEVAFQFVDDGARLEVQAGRAKMRFPVLPAGDFPLAGFTSEPVARATVEAVQLRATMKAAEPYMARDGALYALNGVNLTADGGSIATTATDGGRLFQKTIAGSALEGEFESAIVPAQAVKWLTRFAPKAGAAWVEIAERWACFDFPALRIVTKLIDGVFPVYVAPDREAVARVTMSALSDAIDLVATIAGHVKARPFRLQLIDGDLILSAGDDWSGTGETAIKGGIAGMTLDMRFFATPLLSSLKAFAKGELLVIEHAGDNLPLVIRSDDRPDTEIVIAPIREAAVEQPLERPIVTFQSPDSVGLQHFYRVQVKTMASQAWAEWRTYAFPSAAAANRAYRRHVADARLRCDVTAEALEVLVWPDRDVGGRSVPFRAEIPVAGFMQFPPWYEAEARRRTDAIHMARIVFADGFDSDVPWTRAVFDHTLCSELATTPQITANAGRTKAHRVVGERRLKQAAIAPVAALVEVAPVAAQLEVVPVPAGFTELTVEYLLDMEARAARIAEAVAVFGSVNDNDIPWTRKVLGLKLADAVEATPYLTVTTGRNGPIRALGATALAQSFRRAA